MLDTQDTLNSNPYGSYHSGFTIGGRPQNNTIVLTTSPSIREEERTISHTEKPSAYIVSWLLGRLAKSTFKRLILTTPLCQHYLLSMSMGAGIAELTGAVSERGQVTQRPPHPICAVQDPRVSCSLVPLGRLLRSRPCKASPNRLS